MRGGRALDAESLLRSVGEYAPGITVHECDCVEDAVNRFILNRNTDTEVYAAGSLYLVGEIRGLLQNNAETELPKVSK